MGPLFNEQALIREYAAAAIFVYPSLAAKGEAFGLAPLEAMAAGCAVIVSKLACFDDYIQDGANALQVDFSQGASSERLAKELAQLMGDRAKREQLGSAAGSKRKNFVPP